MADRQTNSLRAQATRIANMEQEIRVLKMKLESEKAEKLRLKEQNTSTNRKLARLEQEVLDRDSKAASRRAQIAELETQGMTHVAGAYDKVTKENTELTGQLRDALVKDFRRATEIAGLKKHVESLEASVETHRGMTEQYEKMDANMANEIKDLKIQVRQKEDKIREAQDAADKAADEMADLHIADSNTIAELKSTIYELKYSAAHDTFQIASLQEEVLRAALLCNARSSAQRNEPAAPPITSSAKPDTQVENPIARMFKAHAKALSESATSSSRESSSGSTKTGTSSDGLSKSTSSEESNAPVMQVRAASDEVVHVQTCEFPVTNEIHLTISIDAKDTKRRSLLQHARDALASSSKLTVLGPEEHVNAFLKDLQRVQDEYASQAVDISHWQDVASRTMEEVNRLHGELNNRPPCILPAHTKLETELKAKGEQLDVQSAASNVWHLKMNCMRAFVDRANAEMSEQRKANAELCRQQLAKVHQRM